MSESAFRADPYAVLDVPRDARAEDIKRRWRELAREHHPDRAAGDAPAQQRLTAQMARINAAWDVLRDPARRARYDASPQAWRAREAERATGRGPGMHFAPADARPGGPPAPIPTRPVTARFDTSAAFMRRNATTGEARPVRGPAPLDRRGFHEPRDLRASTPTGPVRKRRDGTHIGWPTLEEARAAVLEFGRFHGVTLGEVARREPTYIDWIAKTITRDRDLVIRARVIAADLDERGVERTTRPSRAGFGEHATERETAEASARWMGREAERATIG